MIKYQQKVNSTSAIAIATQLLEPDRDKDARVLSRVADFVQFSDNYHAVCRLAASSP
jgi:hypothetical protein